LALAIGSLRYLVPILTIGLQKKKSQSADLFIKGKAAVVLIFGKGKIHGSTRCIGDLREMFFAQIGIGNIQTHRCPLLFAARGDFVQEKE